MPTKLTIKQKEALRKEKREPVIGLPLSLGIEADLNGNVIVPHYDCVTSHTVRRTGITNMYLSHKTQKPFMDYIKLSSEEIADETKLAGELEAQVWL